MARKKNALFKADEDAAKDLFGKKQRLWTRAFQRQGCNSDLVDNNLCEAFNSSIVESRYKSIITLFEDIRCRMMERIPQKRQYAATWKQKYGPLIKKKFDRIKEDCVDWRMRWNGEDGFELRKGMKQYSVDLKTNTCTCRVWQLSGIPCQHACAALWKVGKNPDDYLHPCYHVETYLRAYAFPLMPIDGENEWPKSGLEPVLPPVDKVMPGRPKKARNKKKGEKTKLKPGHLSRAGQYQSCRKCWQRGHNKARCKTAVNSIEVKPFTFIKS